MVEVELGLLNLNNFIIGTSNMKLTSIPIVFGCEQLGGHKWGDVDIPTLENALLLALDQGIELFDTADCYGLGKSEERLGKVFTNYPKAKIATKGGVRLGQKGVFYDCSKTYLSSALDASLRRLGREQIDLYQMHHWDKKTPISDICCTLESFVQEGKIASYGLCNITELPQNRGAFPNLVTFSLEYGLSERTQEGKIIELKNTGITFLPYGCLGQGILSGKYSSASDLSPKDRRSQSKYKNFHSQNLVHNLAIVEVLKRWSKILKVPMASIALAFVRQHLKSNTLCLIGIKRPTQVLEALDSLSFQLPPEALKELDSVSTLKEGAGKN